MFFKIFLVISGPDWALNVPKDLQDAVIKGRYKPERYLSPAVLGVKTPD
jgi:hypothetical protein